MIDLFNKYNLFDKIFNLKYIIYKYLKEKFIDTKNKKYELKNIDL